MATPWVAAALTAYLHQNPEATSEEAVTQLRAALQFTDTSGNETPGLFDEEARARFLGTEFND